jgi:hypothetical protein
MTLLVAAAQEALEFSNQIWEGHTPGYIFSRSSLHAAPAELLPPGWISSQPSSSMVNVLFVWIHCPEEHPGKL